MSEEEKQEALRAVVQAAEDLGYDDVETRVGWVVYDGEYHFEEVRCIAMWGWRTNDGRTLWLDGNNLYRDVKDIFDTELEARNELERRLYQRAENLRKHREAMTRLLVNCVDTMGGGE